MKLYNGIIASLCGVALIAMLHFFFPTKSFVIYKSQIAKGYRNIPTKQKVKELIYKLGIKHPDIVYKQVLYETGHLNKQSYGYRNNNLFCFSFDGTTLLEFSNWEESVYYYKFWQKYKTKYMAGNYYDHLKRYWGAPSMEIYINTLQRMKDS